MTNTYQADTKIIYLKWYNGKKHVLWAVLSYVNIPIDEILEYPFDRY